jgi:radical SAM protein with 4Fe4S-binding SPASM domain
MLKNNKKFVDPLIKRKKNISSKVQYYNNIPIPSIIEISESGTCNRKCSFCPRSAPDYNDVKEFIPTRLIEKIAKELSEYSYEGIILFSGFVEPLLDKNIYNLINILRKSLPKARIEMVTNGDVLNKERVKKIFESGLSTLLVSVYDSKEDAIRLENLLNNCNLSDDQFKIRHRYLPPNEDFGITLSNRSGMMENAEYKIKTLKEPLNENCYYPFYTFFIDYTGEVLICSHDWGKKLVAGNIKDKTILDIWKGPKFKNARKLLGNGNRKFSPCNKCDVQGVLMGTNHYSAWNNIDK